MTWYRQTLLNQQPVNLRTRTRFSAWLVFCCLTISLALTTTTSADQVVNNRGDVLGSFGGLTQTIDLNGRVVTGMNVVTETGYVIPLTNDGEVGLLAPVYYESANCSGAEFASVEPLPDGSSAYSGMVYRSPQSGKLRYIAQHSGEQIYAVRSRTLFKAKNTAVCEQLDASLMLLPSLLNDETLSGYGERFGATTVEIQRSGNSLPQQDNRSIAERFGFTESVNDEPIPMEQQECSPGCNWPNIGNNSCEVTCYVEACNFDNGDCDNESQEFMQEELAKYCSPGCLLTGLGDGFCDTPCNNSACRFDDGDCDQQ